MPNYPKIWFLRHGQTEWNKERRLQGHLDSPLTPLGISQARDQARLMAPFLEHVALGSGGFYVSPLGRAQHTARIALGSSMFHTDARLSEIATGAWEGQLRDDVTAGRTDSMGDLMLYASAPDGEGFDALEARVRAFLDDLTGPSVLVSHGLLGKILRGVVCGLSRADMDRLSNFQGCAYVLENGNETCLGPLAETGEGV